MQIIHSKDIPAAPVTTEGAEKATIRQLITAETGAPTFAMRLFEVAPGGHTPVHAHDWEHEVFILSGTGRVFGGGREVALSPGYTVFVPPMEEHQFTNDGDEVLRFVCLIPLLKRG